MNRKVVAPTKYNASRQSVKSQNANFGRSGGHFVVVAVNAECK